MNWDAIGAMSELLGALAVVATLIYFSIQLRGMRASTAGDSVARAQETELKLIQLELEYSNLLVKANKGAELTSEEHYQLLKLFRSRWSGHLLEFVRTKSLGFDSRVAARNMARSLSENASYMKHYADRSESPDPNVQAFVEQIEYYLQRGVV